MLYIIIQIQITSWWPGKLTMPEKKVSYKYNVLENNIDVFIQELIFYCVTWNNVFHSWSGVMY